MADDASSSTARLTRAERWGSFEDGGSEQPACSQGEGALGNAVC